AALAARLRADPRVASVQRERRATLRDVPDDPALTTPETTPGTPLGTVVEWWAAREHLPEAWDLTHGTGAVVAVIDQGIDGSHPEFAGRIAGTIDLDSDPGSGTPLEDTSGHGTHVASMACAAAGNGIGLAGAGYGCSLLVIRSDLSDSSIATAIVQATDRGADSINMSFGMDGRANAPNAEKRAIDYAYKHDVVMVAAAADQPVTEQGDPANALQPTDSGPTLGSGKGLSITAADIDDRRAAFAGFGTQISMAAYGAFHYTVPKTPNNGPPGIFGAFPAGPTDIEQQDSCDCRTTFGGDTRYAYLQGTSMAAPMVAAVAALMRDVNPGLHAHDVIRLLEQTATRAAGSGWNQDLGWGILNAGAAVAAARDLDRTRPVSRLTAPRKVHGRHTFVLRWTGHDPAPAGLVSSGIARYEVWRAIGGRPAKRIAVTTKRTLRMHGTPTRTYSFYTRAVDNAGNHEGRPASPDARTRVVRR
ncbi:MAG: family serine peptidase, partial [Solirubrobacterales bacterium]|nr:family serine peptidase [Solirubrobacterales bacterium]